MEWFNACDLRVGKIKECIICEESDKLYIEKVDLGEGDLRTIASGVRQYISIDEMKKDAFVLVFSNLKPRPIAGYLS